MKIVEIFHSIQGEGILIGVPSIFVRLAGCNLRCLYCDTKYAWDTHYKDLTPTEVFAEIIRIVGDNGNNLLVTISGGEPLLYEKELVELAKILKNHGFRIAIETNGTICPGSELVNLIDYFNVSPKLKSFNSSYPGAISLKCIPCEKLVLKFVVTEPHSDFIEIQNFLSSTGLKCDRNRIVVQPNNFVLDYKTLVEYVVNNKLNFRVLPQLHKLIGVK